MKVAWASLLVLGTVSNLFACGSQTSPAPEPRTSVEASRDFQLLGRSGRVAMGRLHLGASRAVRIPASPCQEVLLFVEQGALRHEDYGWLRHGDAARFHSMTVLETAAAGQTRVFAAIVQHEALRADPVYWEPVRDDSACPASSSPSVMADRGRSGPFVHADGKLRVHVYLDANEDPTALGALGTLDADPSQAVPEHIHPQSAEVLWIVDGAGTMRLGDREKTIQPGTFVFVPAGTLHGFVPDGSRPLFAYQIYTPAGPEQRFKPTDQHPPVPRSP